MGWPSLRRIVDDRGTQRTSYGGRGLLFEGAPDMPEDEYRELCRRLRGQQWVWSAMLWILAACFGVRFVSRMMRGGYGWDAIPAAAFIAIWAFMAKRSYSAFPDRPGWHVAQELRKMGRCPCCTYRLPGIIAESDGCTVCPECGAAWKLLVGPVPPSHR